MNTRGFSVPVRSLKEVIKKIGGIVRSGGRECPVLDSLLFEEDRGRVRITGTDMKQFARYTFDEGGAQKNAVLGIKLKDLRDILKEVRGDTLNLFRVDDKIVEVRYEEDLWRAVIEVEARDLGGCDLGLDESGFKKMKETPEFFVEYRKALSFSSIDNTRWALNGVFFSSEGDVVATDGRRLVVKEGGTVYRPEGGTIPTSRFLRDVKSLTHLGFKDKRVYVKGANWEYSVPIVEETFPNYKQVIPSDAGKLYFSLGGGAVEAFKMISALMSDSDRGVEIRGSGKKLSLKSKNYKSNRSIDISLDAEGEAGEGIAVSCDYMIDAMKAGFKTFKFGDSFTPLVSEDGEGWKHILMPTRMS